MLRTDGAERANTRRRQHLEDATLFRLLVDRVLDYAIFLLTPDGHIASWNAGAERLKGYTADEIIGHSFEQFYPDEARRAGLPQHLLSIARTDGRVENEGWRVRKDGSRFWADVVITALYDDAGELRGFAKVTRDLTERRAGEEHLRRSEQRFRTLIDSVKDYAIFLLSTEGTVLSWNQGAQQLKGYTPSEIIGESFERFYPPEGRATGLPQHLLSIARTDGRVENEGWRVRKDGSRFWADVVITALRDEHGELIGYAKVTRDLTDRRQAENDRAARLAAERAADRMERLQVPPPRWRRPFAPNRPPRSSPTSPRAPSEQPWPSSAYRSRTARGSKCWTSAPCARASSTLTGSSGRTILTRWCRRGGRTARCSWRAVTRSPASRPTWRRC
jgi:PAS domain S-box-containing protein